MACVSRVCTVRRSSYRTSPCDLRRVRVTTLSHKHIHSDASTITRARARVWDFSQFLLHWIMSSVIQRCACEWLGVHQTVTHTPAAQTMPPSPLTLFVSLCVIQKRLACANGATGRRVGGMQGTLHPPPILHSLASSHLFPCFIIFISNVSLEGPTL